MARITLYKQSDSMQCGIACLQMICKHFGREYSMDSLSRLCFATTEGVSLLGINDAANTLGLHTTCAKATTSIPSSPPMSLCGQVIGGKIVVILSFQGQNLYIPKLCDRKPGAGGARWSEWHIIGIKVEGSG